MDSAKLTSGTPAVVYVHGAGNKPPREDLKRSWDQHLFGADMGERTRMAHYADVLHPQPGQISADACNQEQLLAALVSRAMNDTTAALDEVLASEESGEGAQDTELLERLTPRGRQLALNLSLSMAARAAGRPPVGAAPNGALEVSALMPLPATLRRLLLRQLLRRLIPDADAYFFTPSNEPIRARLRQVLEAASGPVVIVSHSLGTVVAYDVLRERRFADLAVPLLVTVGSPLGYAEIQDVITRPLRVPSQVGLWANFADPLDVVTLDTTLADDFRAAPRILADARVDNRSPNNHAVCGYLTTSKVRATVAAAVPGPGG
ncbi:hypothetical protein [Actinomadura macra]|uniref:hypothetical protein n=1 Tax=Actinomadura macra TaxID=46164 RepID=UPI00082C2F4A|nr:hypothetical protein [Actinomadura macra]